MDSVHLVWFHNFRHLINSSFALLNIWRHRFIGVDVWQSASCSWIFSASFWVKLALFQAKKHFFLRHSFRGSSLGNYGKSEVDGEHIKETLVSIEFNLHGQKWMKQADFQTRGCLFLEVNMKDTTWSEEYVPLHRASRFKHKREVRGSFMGSNWII